MPRTRNYLYFSIMYPVVMDVTQNNVNIWTEKSYYMTQYFTIYDELIYIENQKISKPSKPHPQLCYLCFCMLIFHSFVLYKMAFCLLEFLRFPFGYLVYRSWCHFECIHPKYIKILAYKTLGVCLSFALGHSWKYCFESLWSFVLIKFWLARTVTYIMI